MDSDLDDKRCCYIHAPTPPGWGWGLQGLLFLLPRRILYGTCSTCTLPLALVLREPRYRRYISSCRSGGILAERSARSSRRTYTGEISGLRVSRHPTGREGRRGRYSGSGLDPRQSCQRQAVLLFLLSIDLCSFDKLLQYESCSWSPDNTGLARFLCYQFYLGSQSRALPEEMGR